MSSFIDCDCSLLLSSPGSHPPPFRASLHTLKIAWQCHEKCQIIFAVFLATLRSYVAERKGERDEMQDAHVLMDNCADQFGQLVNHV